MFEIQKIVVAKADYARAEQGAGTPAYQALMDMLNHVAPEFIASGSFGAVYGAAGGSGDVVYKVCHAASNRAYMSFIKQLSKQTVDNVFLPKIHGCAVYTSDLRGGDSWFVVIMERLCDHQPVGFFQAIHEVRSLCRALPGAQRLVAPAVLAAVSLLRRARRSCRAASWDLHAGNFMIRDLDQLVITDPLA